MLTAQHENVGPTLGSALGRGKPRPYDYFRKRARRWARHLISLGVAQGFVSPKFHRILA
jgi:hypothetical protein